METDTIPLNTCSGLELGMCQRMAVVSSLDVISVSLFTNAAWSTALW